VRLFRGRSSHRQGEKPWQESEIYFLPIKILMNILPAYKNIFQANGCFFSKIENLLILYHLLEADRL
jgi:hypothetical protein